jgi:uncharacterized protein (TIGR00369 family)
LSFLVTEHAVAVDQAMQRLREEMRGPPFHDFLQPEAISADMECGTVVVRLAFRDIFARGANESFFHGGVIAALIDLVAHAAVALKLGRMVPTIDLRIDFLHAAPGVDLYATGRVLRSGRTTAVADVDVRAGSDRIVATGRGVFSTAPAGQAKEVKEES